MTELAGAAVLTRFILRRDRVRIVVWVAAIAALVALTAASVKGLYPTQADLDEAAALSADNAAAIAFNGPVQGLDTMGGQVAFQAGTTALIVVALMSLLMTGRLTRGEEEAGRLELVRALPVGAHAPTAASVLVVVAMNAAVGVLVALALVGLDLPVYGAVTFGASFTLLGLVFVGITLVAAQVTENTRVVYGLAGAVLGAAFVLRAVGDIGDGALSWFSPIGWVQKTRPFAGEKWWPFLLVVAAIGGLIVVARALAARRDLGSGLVPPRPGPSQAAPGLGTPLGLAGRLQRGSFIGWTVGVLCLAAAYGSVVDDIEDFVADNEALADWLARVGGASLTDAYLATTFRILALVGSGFAVQSAMRLRSEETSLRAEPVLATPVSRTRWAGGHLTIAFGGSVLVLAVAGLTMGLTYGLIGGGLGVVPRLLGAALVYAPAMWVLIGLAVLLEGVAPRAVVVPWVVLGVCFVIGMLGNLLDVPGWLRDLSPFEHVPALPADPFALLPLAVLVGLAAGLTAAGLVGLRRRDIG